MSKIISYMYEGRYHCVTCAQLRFAVPPKYVRAGVNVDENAINPVSHDRNGELIVTIREDSPLPTDLSDNESGQENLHCHACYNIIKKRLPDLN